MPTRCPTRSFVRGFRRHLEIVCTTTRLSAYAFVPRCPAPGSVLLTTPRTCFNPLIMTIAPDSPRSVSSTDSNAALPSFEALAPPRAFLTKPSEETVIEIPNLHEPIRLKVDAGPGCGGIAWPAGEVSAAGPSRLVNPTLKKTTWSLERSFGSGTISPHTLPFELTAGSVAVSRLSADNRPVAPQGQEGAGARIRHGPSGHRCWLVGKGVRYMGHRSTVRSPSCCCRPPRARTAVAVHASCSRKVTLARAIAHAQTAPGPDEAQRRAQQRLVQCACRRAGLGSRDRRGSLGRYRPRARCRLRVL